MFGYEHAGYTNSMGLVKNGAVAGVAGLLATKAMESSSSLLYRFESKRDREREEAARPGPPYEVAAVKTAAVLGVELDDSQRERAGLVFHYGLALSWAPLYIVLRRGLGLSPLQAGLASGASMSVIVDEGLTPLLGFSARNSAYPLSTHVRAFIAHLVFGVTVGVVTEGSWRVLGETS